MRMPTIDRAALFRLAPFAAGALIVAGIVHIATILALPQVSGKNAAQRLLAAGPVNTLETLATAPSEADPLLPFADPAAVTAVCRFDIEDGPVRLRVPTGESFLSVVILSPTGRVLLALTDRAATRRLLNLVLLTAEQQRQIESQDPDDEPVQELRVRLAATTGVAVIRTLALREADRRPAAAALARASCQQE